MARAPSHLTGENLMGDLIREIYRFIYEGNASPNHILFDPVQTYEPVKASDFFQTYRTRGRDFAVKQERLPLDPHIKAVHFQKGLVKLETGKIDFDELEEILWVSSSKSQVRGKSIYNDETQIVSTRTENVGNFDEMDMRTLVSLLPSYGSSQSEVAIEVADILYNNSPFLPNSGNSDEALVTQVGIKRALEMKQELRMDLNMVMARIQMPKLLFRLDQNRYVIARKAYRAKILKMSRSELEAHIKGKVEKPSQHSE